MPALSPAHEALGRHAREQRVRLGLSQEELGERAGFHRNYVGYLERGEQNVSLANLLRWAAALELSAAELVRVAEEADAGGRADGAPAS